MPIKISNQFTLPDSDIELKAIHAQGAGGQNVNKVATAVHLRFDITASSLPEFYKQRLMASSDRRISKDGIVIIKAQRFRSQEKNREDALFRLEELFRSVSKTEKTRKVTKPTYGSQLKRLDSKTQRGRVKQLRKSRPTADD
ncbi:MAG: alternative ribosome rescue aminoacyl-tRNA hydrolase ArfB [Gammaproteobacteria bacterium]|nr:alternative ribosome rescue aminoacyl-tRNA hydrolase ArfB [Gammaproteobacteria bacterium]